MMRSARPVSQSRLLPTGLRPQLCRRHQAAAACSTSSRTFMLISTHAAAAASPPSGQPQTGATHSVGKLKEPGARLRPAEPEQWLPVSRFSNRVETPLTQQLPHSWDSRLRTTATHRLAAKFR